MDGTPKDDEISRLAYHAQPIRRAALRAARDHMLAVVDAELDQASYFVIHAGADRIIVEHYDYQERLLRSVEGCDARTVYWTLIANGWVAKLDHAAYLGKELARAENSVEAGLEFVQDGA